MTTIQAASRNVCIRFLLAGGVLLTLTGTRMPAVAAASEAVSRARATAAVIGRAGLTAANWDLTSIGSIDRQVFELALSAASCAVRAGAAVHPATLTIIDYSKPSTEKRLWVYDLASRALLFQELVAHGQGTGANLATSFSNLADSHQSSLGLFLTEGTYVGKNGYSLRLNGLDQGFNDRARERAIVIHGAPYVDSAMARTIGRLGRSWGCPAVRSDIARNLIDQVKDGGLVFAYYPDQKWLSASKYLGNCAAANP